MARAAVAYTSFNAGEWSPLMEGRVDLQKYPNACKLLENFIPTVQGPAVRRGGTRYMGEVKDSSAVTRFLRFEFNTSQAYAIELGNYYMRFWANHAPVTVSGVAAWVTTTAYTVGDLVVQGGTNYYCTTAHTSGTFATDLANGDWYALTGNIYEIPTPWSTADLTDTDGTFKPRYVQSGDVIYIVHPSYAPRKLSRYGSTRWTLTQPVFAGGPFQTVNSDGTTTVYANAAAGSVTLTASASIFQAAHVGALFYLGERDVRATNMWTAGGTYGASDRVRSGNINYTTAAGGTAGGTRPSHTTGTAQDGSPGVAWAYNDPGYGWVQITGYTSGTSVSATVLSTLPYYTVGAGNATTRWAMGAWNGVDGYPSQVCFFRERLTFAAGIKVWLSVAGDYENFRAKDDSGQVVADQAISIQVVARRVNNIMWLDPGQDLLIGTAGGEFRLCELTKNQVFGPENITVQPQSEYGSKSMQPVRVGPSTVHVQRSGKKIRELAYDFGPDNYKSTDLTVLSEHITKGGVVSVAWQQEPFSIIWYARADGTLCGLTFNREQDVVAWHRQPLGGSGAVEALIAIPTPDTTRDELWLLVKRTINGATKRYVEYMEVEHQNGNNGDIGTDPEQDFYVDCGLSYDGAQSVTLTPGAGATVAHTTGVTFTAGAAVWSSGDVGREIHYRYISTTVDKNGNTIKSWQSAKALITAYTDSTHVVCTINRAFPSLATLAAGAWRMTATTLSGLSHLEGQTVDVLANGAVHPQCVVSGGTITLQAAASVAQVGLPCPAKLWTMRMNAGAQDGTSQGKTARINKVAVRFLETLGAQFGSAPTAALDDVLFRSTGDAMDTPPPLFTGDKLVDFDGGYTTEPRVFVQSNQPLPCTVVGLFPTVSTYDRG